MISTAEVSRAADRVLQRVAADPRYAHTSHLRVDVDGTTVVDEHLGGPASADTFSITKSVLGTVLGVLALDGFLPDLDDAVADVLPELRGTPAAAHTWRHLLTMTRGAQVDGPWDIDEVTARPGGQVAHIAAAPQLHPPGAGFRYDNGASHLVSAAACAVAGESVADLATRRLFDPLGIDADWATDPDGIPFGYAHLRLGADGLARLGRLWLDGGRLEDRQLVDPAHLQQMFRAHTAGGPPEGLAYGLLGWVGDDLWMASGWAGQHLLVVPSARAVVVTTGDPRFTLGPPARDELPPDWLPAIGLVRRLLLPVLHR